MPALVRLSQRDLDRLISVVAEAAPVDGDQPFELEVIERLLELIPADRAGYYEYAGRGGKNMFLSEKPAFDFNWPCPPSNLTRDWPLNDEHPWMRSGPVLFSDFVPHSGRHRDPWYAEVMRPQAMEFECKLLLPGPEDRTRGFFFIRAPGTKDFDERDRTVLALLQPHLAEIRERWQRRREPSGLTAREAEIMRLLALGLTNQEIGAELVVATGTVRRHLENIYEKLGVHTRTAAVAAAKRGRSAD